MLDRISRILKSGADPRGVFFMSFTKAAAQEVLGRLGLPRSDNFSTIHSLCYRITRVHHGAVVDHKKLKELSAITGVAITGARYDDEEGLSDGDMYLQIINRAENLMIPVDEAYERSDRPGEFEEFMMFASTYSEWKGAYGFVDFNDMLKRMLGPGIKFSASHLLVDEGQDLSPLQWKVIDRLIQCSDPKSVHVAGDDDQCLYSFAGADPHGMFDFEDRHGAKREVLSQSWRIPKSVHTLAHDVIGSVSKRVDKKYDPRDEVGEVSYSVDVGSLDIEHGENVMFLGRTHSALKDVEQLLKDKALPYRKASGVCLFTNRYALAIRGVLKAGRGEVITDAEYNALLKVVIDPSIRGEVECGNYSALRGHRWKDVLNIPFSMLSYYEDVDIEAEPTIVLSTIHGSKGKESDRVVLLTEQTARVAESMNTVNGADDEHRCMYVGITRAKHKLDIITSDEGYRLP